MCNILDIDKGDFFNDEVRLRSVSTFCWNSFDIPYLRNNIKDPYIIGSRLC